MSPFKPAVRFSSIKLLTVLLSLTFLIFLSFSAAVGQTEEETVDSDSLKKYAPKLFLDCNYCDHDYIRREIPFVNYVRDTREAQIHLMITSQRTGSGGEAFTLYFIGQLDFAGKSDTLVYISGPDDTDEEVRERSTNLMKIGLIPYIAKTPLVNSLIIGFTESTDPTEVVDKWNSWVFSINGNSWLSGEASLSNMNLWYNASADRVTPEWKIEMSAGGSYNESRFDLGDDSLGNANVITSIRRYQYGDVEVVKSLGDHWSAGVFAATYSSIFNNVNASTSGALALEYNIFPYEESSKKQLRTSYKIGYRYNDYMDTTINNKLYEGLMYNSLGVAFEVIEKWGSVDVYLQGFNYFPDVSINNLIMRGRVNIRITKGLSFNVSGRISLIHDQISLPKGDATQEEILLQQTQLATNYSYNGSVGLRYTFGSIYNNVVNPRFGN
ncbi:MAG: hypothetical protein IIA45_11180 [Bacteroidetes bacterium]|nr:hypothetical protein [Bacteroidota bacterium]